MRQSRDTEQNAESSDYSDDSTALSRFASFLRKRIKARSAWAQSNNISCYRIYDAEVFPYAVAIDVYEGAAEFAGQTYLVVSHYRNPDSPDEDELQSLKEAVRVAALELKVAPERIFEKVRHHDREGSHYKDGQRDSFVVRTQEAGYLFEVDLKGYLDTGIFLDHRPVRELIGQRAQGARFLNLFAYTGTATVYAAGAGAAHTTTIDLSRTYLDWAQRNMELNELGGPQHRFIQSDARHWLERDIRKGTTYDLVFVDPPTFSRSKKKGKKTWNVARDHVELLKKVEAVLKPQGTAIFSCNLRDFKPDFAALSKEGIELCDITAQTIPPDFEQNQKIHQCYLLQR